MNRNKPLHPRTSMTYRRIAGFWATTLWLLPAIAQQVGEPDSGSNLFFFNRPDNQLTITLIGAAALSVLLGIGIYRAFLKRNVKNGMHPQVFAWTVVFAFAAIDLWLILAALFEFDRLGVGYAAVISGIFLFTLLLLMFVGKLHRSIMLLVLLLAGLAVFQYLNHS